MRAASVADQNVYEESTTETHPRMFIANSLLQLGKITIGIHTTVANDAQINISYLQRILRIVYKQSSNVHIWSLTALTFSVHSQRYRMAFKITCSIFYMYTYMAAGAPAI
jgi:hypothetical protein